MTKKKIDRPENANSIGDIIDIINGTTGKKSATTLDDTSVMKTDIISTGVDKINEAIGIGGIPRGRITEVFGAEASGKTSLCLQTAAQANALGMNVGFIDTEQSLTRKHLQNIGIQEDKFVISQPDSGEEALEIVELMLLSKQFALIIIDSVAALTPQSEKDKNMGESPMASHARLMSQAMRKLAAPIREFNVAVMFTNQTRAKIGFMTRGETTTGGNALKFYASLRMNTKYVGVLKDGSGKKKGGKYKLIIVKNKMAVPFREVDFRIDSRGLYVK